MVRIKLKDGQKEMEIEGDKTWVEKKLKEFAGKEKGLFRFSIYSSE